MEGKAVNIQKEVIPKFQGKMKGSLAKVLLHLAFLVISILEVTTAYAATQMYFIHNDHLGAPQVVTNQSQAVVWKGDKVPFGETTEAFNAIDQNARFPGQYLDVESQLHYNYYRDYDPSVGRYIQSDPIGLRGGLGLYTYVENNPLNYTDLEGERPIRPGGNNRGGYGSGGTHGGAGGTYGQVIGNGYTISPGVRVPPSIPIYQPPRPAPRPINLPGMFDPNNNRQQETLRRLFEQLELLEDDVIEKQNRTICLLYGNCPEPPKPPPPPSCPAGSL